MVATELVKQRKQLEILPEYSLLFFDFNKTDLGLTEEGILDKVAKDIRIFNPRKVIVSGHTDLIGSYEYNMKLATDRGWKAANYLIRRHGIEKDLIDVKAYGINKPRNDPSNKKRDMRNRYVRIQFEFENKFYNNQ